MLRYNWPRLQGHKVVGRLPDVNPDEVFPPNEQDHRVNAQRNKVNLEIKKVFK